MTSEQSALIDKAKASLKAARLLKDEGHPDFAISRAYYTIRTV
ncbi:MAG: HEPN domain-containing protein [Deltaproteobacteria bacterium]|nr:HEPN domain-containing protein [Deltaproteobacteria bacterium]